jgi:hypothetical protein
MESPTEPEAELGPVPSGFNLGAFLFTPLFLICYGRAGTGCLLYIIPVISLILFGLNSLFVLVLPVAILAALYFGLNANEVAWATERFKTYAELRKSMLGWNIAGALAICLVVIAKVMD